MNKIYKGLLFLAAVSMVAACDIKQENVKYLPKTTDPSMLNEHFYEEEILFTEEEIGLPVVRANSAGAYTLSLEALLPDGLFLGSDCTVLNDNFTNSKGVRLGSLVSFKIEFVDGQSQSDVVFKLGQTLVGSKYQGFVRFASDVEYNKNVGIDSCFFSLAKAYSWTSIGEGEYYDDFVGNRNAVEVLKAEGFDRYRIVNPYPAAVLTGEDLGYSAAGEAWGIGGAACPYIEFWVEEDGKHVSWNTKFSTTLDYTGDGDTIWIYYPTAFAKYAPYAAYCALDDNEPKVVWFYGVAYIDGIGGFDVTPCVLSLPGGPGLDFLFEE